MTLRARGSQPAAAPGGRPARALAMQRGGQLATFDAGIKSLLPLGRQQSVYVIPV